MSHIEKINFDINKLSQDINSIRELLENYVEIAKPKEDDELKVDDIHVEGESILI